jgi:hypothetical protein
LAFEEGEREDAKACSQVGEKGDPEDFRHS